MGEALSNHTPAPIAPTTKRGKLKVIKGGAVLGRETNVDVRTDDFNTSSVIRNMSTARIPSQVVYDAIPGKRDKIERPERNATSSTEIIKTVLGVTHRDVGKIALKELFDEVDEDYEVYKDQVKNGTLKDEEIKLEIEKNDDKFKSTDLMVGMETFTEATRDHYGDMYDATILEPATRFAQWLIYIETQK